MLRLAGNVVGARPVKDADVFGIERISDERHTAWIVAPYLRDDLLPLCGRQLVQSAAINEHDRLAVGTQPRLMLGVSR